MDTNVWTEPTSVVECSSHTLIHKRLSLRCFVTLKDTKKFRFWESRKHYWPCVEEECPSGAVWIIPTTFFPFRYQMTLWGISRMPLIRHLRSTRLPLWTTTSASPTISTLGTSQQKKERVSITNRSREWGEWESSADACNESFTALTLYEMERTVEGLGEDSRGSKADFYAPGPKICT